MGCSQFFGPPGRMKRIAEAQKPGNAPFLELPLRNHAGHASAKGFSADDQPARRLEVADGITKLFEQALRAWRRALAAIAPALRHVGEFEARHCKTTLCKSLSKRGHERCVHRRPRPVRQKNLRMRSIGAVSQEFDRHLPYCLIQLARLPRYKWVSWNH